MKMGRELDDKKKTIAQIKQMQKCQISMFGQSWIIFTYRGSGWNSSTDPADPEMTVRAEVAATIFSLGLAPAGLFGFLPPTSRISFDDEGTGVNFMEDPVLELEGTAFGATEEGQICAWL